MKYFFILLLTGYMLSSCENGDDVGETVPVYYYSLLDAEGNPLITTEDQTIDMWCFDDENNKLEINDIQISACDSYYKLEFGSSLIPLYAGNSGINHFYINQGDGDIDTLYFTVTSSSAYYVGEVKFNGKEVVRDTTYHWPYILKK